MLTSVLLEETDEVLARVERTVGIFESIIEIHSHNIINGDVRRTPSSAVDTAVQPVDVTVRARMA